MSSSSAARRSLTKKQAALLVTVGGIVLGLAACSASSSGTATSSSAKSAESPTSARDIGFANWTAFGVKAANVATLRTFALPDVFVPDGYAVPFYFYDKFMSFNGLYDRMARMLKDPKFRSNPTYQAFLERDFYRIDHLATAMGVLVYPHFQGETANGVAVTADPVYRTDDAFYVNTQVGADLVTNPQAKSTPEELLIYGDGNSAVLTHSNRVEPGETVLTEAQIAVIKRILTIIRDRFATLYDVKSGQKFAMEIEFKVLNGGLAIKQARTWIYH